MLESMVKTRKEETNAFTGDVRAVECEDCRIDAGSIHLSALGIKGLVVKVENNVVTVAKKSWLKRHIKGDQDEKIGNQRVA